MPSSPDASATEVPTTAEAPHRRKKKPASSGSKAPSASQLAALQASNVTRKSAAAVKYDVALRDAKQRGEEKLSAAKLARLAEFESFRRTTQQTFDHRLAEV